MAITVRLIGWTAIEAAERGGLTLSKATDPTESARDGLSVEEARAVAAEDPSLVFLDLPVSGGRIDVGAGRVWLEHPQHGWIEMPASYDAERVTAEDLVHDSQLRTLSDREVRDTSEGAGAIEAIRAELDRLEANDDGTGLEVEEHPDGARFYDTQVRAVYNPAEALSALRALPDGAGFEETWQALAHLQEVV